jgi:hypothetical protein
MNYLPAHVLGMYAVGKVTNADYTKALLPLLDKQVKQNGKINFLLILETDIQNFTAGAWYGNIEIGLKYLFRWKKLAVVTDQKSVQGFRNLFKYILPGKYRGYSLNELDEAIKWVAEK